MTKNPQPDQKNQAPLTEDQVSNVDLQFMGKKNAEERLEKRVEVQSKAPGEFQERGMDKADVESAQSMIASDPPSSNMGEEK